MKREYKEPSFFPEPMARVEYALKTYGGWNKRFGKSFESREEDIIAREGNPGFWVEYAIARGNEYFGEEVTKCCKELKGMGDSRKNEELEKLVSRALKMEGWKPPIGKIKKEIALKKRTKRAEIQELRGYVKELKLERRRRLDNGKAC